MAYLALYRKYRPSTFDEVKGQDHVVNTLKNQLNAGRVGHAYLFCGTRGTGKTSVAKLFAKAVNCESPVDGSPCGQCAVCKAIEDHTSLNVIEIDAASNNSVNNVRDIIEEVKYSPTEGRYKVYIIDEVHMLSPGAFNALLKTLEEPPSYVIFILATTEANKIPITILSRCQRYDFKRISVDTITECLKGEMVKENVTAEEKALRYVAKVADGSMRDAQSLLDQCLALYMGQDLTFERVIDALGTVDIEVFAKLLRFIDDQRVNKCLEIIDDIALQGREMTQFVNDFIGYLRNLLIIQTAEYPENILQYSSEKIELMRQEAKCFEEPVIIRFIKVLSELSNKIRYAVQKRLLVEVEIIRLCRPQMDKDRDIGVLLNRIENLEKRLESGEFTRVKYEDEEESQEPAVPEPDLSNIPLSDRIRSIIDNWDRIVEAIDNYRIKYMASVFKIGSADGEKLQLYGHNGLQTGDGRDSTAIKRAMEKVMGFSVDYEIIEASKSEFIKKADLSERLKMLDGNKS
ncbi:MAG: DNA polymerase III subunit gamma/tau [Lachnospiraceae bacterium]|nr:DNA polymerase III subunit gamma/tau [Lachnospiraceae bacterium]